MSERLAATASLEGLEPGADTLTAPTRRWRLHHTWRRVGFTPAGRFGCVALLLMLLVAFVGPFVAPRSPIEVTGLPFAGPSSAALLGTDVLGRDVLSRYLHGGSALIVIALITTCVAYVIGGTIGSFAGYCGGLSDLAIVGAADVFLSIPPIILALVLIAALGSGVGIQAFAVVVVLIAPIVRIVRAVTQEVSTQEFVEAAIARGEGTLYIIVREILPHLRAVLAADFGIRFAWSIVLTSSLSFLGFGKSPPATDWGLMIAENRAGLMNSPWSVLAPALSIGLVAVSMSLIADSVARSAGWAVASGR